MLSGHLDYNKPPEQPPLLSSTLAAAFSLFPPPCCLFEELLFFCYYSFYLIGNILMKWVKEDGEGGQAPALFLSTLPPSFESRAQQTKRIKRGAWDTDLSFPLLPSTCQSHNFFTHFLNSKNPARGAANPLNPHNWPVDLKSREKTAFSARECWCLEKYYTPLIENCFLYLTVLKYPRNSILLKFPRPKECGSPILGNLTNLGQKSTYF